MDSSFAAAAQPSRRERQKCERESKILAAARRLFDRKGFAGTAMEEVAERAGLAVGTLYNYFSSKDELLLAIMSRETDRLMQLGEGIFEDPPRDGAAAICAFADLFVESMSAGERMLWREVFAVSISSPRELGAKLFELDQRLIAMLSILIDELKKQGLLARDVDPDRTAGIVYSICLASGLAFVMSDHMTTGAMRADINASIRSVVRGLLPRGDRKENGR